MSEPARLLNSIGQALAASTLYAAGHPARARTASAAYDRLRELQRVNPRPSFSFIDRDIVYRRRMLREMRDWEWGMRLAAVGIERIEFAVKVPPPEFQNFLADVLQRLAPGASRENQERETNHPSIVFGAIGVRGETGDFLTDESVDALLPTLAEESESLRAMYARLEEGGALDAAEAESVVASLSVAMHGDSEIIMPLLQLKSFDEYTTTHSINVSVLAMALAEFVGVGPWDVRALGVAALLHDIGMTRVPKEMLTRDGPPTGAEWARIREHPLLGARMILAGEPQLDLAAVVAYEHHMLFDGGGYPDRHYTRECHFASKVVQLCAVYDALRTHRYHREALPSENALRYVEDRSGKDFDPDIARAFTEMMRQWERQIATVEEGEPIRPSYGRIAARAPVLAGS